MIRILLALWRLIIPFIVLILGWGVLVSRVLEQSGLNRPVLNTLTQTMAYGAFLIGLFAFGLVLSYNLAAAVYRATRGSPRVTVPVPKRRISGGGALGPYRRIGLILAGGGAKGAYQAGAMRAIWEFLEEHDALDRVCMVAGTSIGAWNAVFWMAGLVGAPATGGENAHEAWWRAVKPERILDFDWYIPLMRNHLAQATPWRETFRRIFVEHAPTRNELVGLLAPRPDRRDRPGTRTQPLHFYLTRSNVERALLEFTTNAWGVADLKRPDARTGELTPVIQPELYHVLDGGDPNQALVELEDAVFASMDIPPLFPYVEMKDPIYGTVESFEDGGVIENLPMFFGTQIEECDLLFVLPLNATFDAAVNRRSILALLSRVMEIRQGVIERDAFKEAYLYNDLHKLTGRPRVSVFAICPAEPLAVGTVDFHKAREAGAAYRLMYETTTKELREAFGQLTPDWIRLATIGPTGERKYIEEF